MRALIEEAQYDTRLHAPNWRRWARTALLLCLTALAVASLPQWAVVALLVGLAAAALWIRLVIWVADKTLDARPDDI